MYIILLEACLLKTLEDKIKNRIDKYFIEIKKTFHESFEIEKNHFFF